MTDLSGAAASERSFPSGGGELSALIRNLDWQATGLGPLSDWPQSLKTVTNLLLQSPLPIVLLWGTDGVMIYNDAYAVFAGGRHPRLLGSKVREGWPEVAEFNDNVMNVVLGGGTLAYKDQELTLHRHGRPERVWMNLNYSPVLNEADQAAGVIAIVLETTERVFAERRLQDRENDLARVQRIAKVGGVSVDLRAGFDNGERAPEYREIHGLKPNASDTHDDWVRRIHPDDRNRTLQRFVEAVNGGDERYTTEYRIIRPIDGQVRWIATEAQIERDDAGHAVRLVGAHMDITDRALAQEFLKESEARFRLIANSAPVPMWVSNSDGTRAFANHAYMQFLGVDYEKALTFDWRTILHPDDMLHIVKESVAGEASLKPFALEARYRRADGEWRWMRSESQPRWDPMGNPIGFIGVAHDITSAKQAEIELRRLNETLEHRIEERTSQLQSNQAQMRAILDTTNQYQSFIDLKGNVVYANTTALAGVRRAANDIVGQPFWDSPWFSATDQMRDVVLTAFFKVIKGEYVRTEMLLHLPVGDRYFDFAMRPVFDLSGAISGVLAEAVDITERRQTEDALRQAQKMEAVGQLTGGVAHDFNNLLTIIRSATDFLGRPDLPEDRRHRYINAISDTVDRASKLTSQLLAFARRQPLSPQIFNVGKQVDSVTQLIRPLVGSRIRITLDLCDPECFAFADVVQFETALVNLAINARDAMAGEGELFIAVKAVQQIPALRGHAFRKDRYVAVSVVDTGSGIANDKLEAIFEPFFTTKEVGKGTGLGLSQAIGFAKQSGGEIEVKSTLGTGSTFTIYLPQADRPATLVEARMTTARAATPGHGDYILVVEDNEDVGRFSTELLEDLGYVVKWVTSGVDALAVLANKDNAFDLVFSDVIMPGMKGTELAGAIVERFPGLPVVLTSGYSSVLAENADRGFELIQKPYSIEALSRVLRKAILQSRGAVFDGA